MQDLSGAHQAAHVPVVSDGACCERGQQWAKPLAAGIHEVTGNLVHRRNSGCHHRTEVRLGGHHLGLHQVHAAPDGADSCPRCAGV